MAGVSSRFEMSIKIDFECFLTQMLRSRLVEINHHECLYHSGYAFESRCIVAEYFTTI